VRFETVVAASILHACFTICWSAYGQTALPSSASLTEQRVWQAAAPLPNRVPSSSIFAGIRKDALQSRRAKSWCGFWCARQRLFAKVVIRAAVAILDRSISLVPDQAQVYAQRGVCRSKIGEPEAAVKDLTYALKLSPADPNHYFNRGTINLNSGNVPAAFDDLGEAIRLRPDYEPAWGNRCSAALRLSRYQQAIDDCTQALRLVPTDQLDLRNRALAYFTLQSYELALADAGAAVRQK
jgi:tetratricopeptide (TPR) repeat protein